MNKIMHETAESRLALPWPPSANNLFVNVRGQGRVTSREYAAWKQEAGWTLQAQRPKKHYGPVRIQVELCSPKNCRYDIDNRVKPVLDLLATHQIIRDDNDECVREVTVRRVPTGAPCTVTVTALV